MQDTLSQRFAALADPTRRAMLVQLSKGQASVSELAKPFLKDMSLPAVTKHLKVLEKAGVIIKNPEDQSRPCQLKRSAFKDLAASAGQHPTLWEQTFDCLHDYPK